MNEEIKQIAERLKGLRDALDIPVEEMAKVCKMSPDEYLRLESGTTNISPTRSEERSCRERV